MVLLRKASTPVRIDQRIFRFVLRRAKNLVTDSEHIQAVRRRMDALARLQPTPRGVTVTPVDGGSVRAEWIIPDGADRDHVILYIHGGAFVICSPATHRPLVSRLALASNKSAFSLCYRLAPEYPFPAALEDCISAYHWLLSERISPEKIVVGGDSAGGNLTLALLVSLRDSGVPLPAAAFCLSPVTDLTATGGSRKSKAQDDPIFGDMTDPGQLVDTYLKDQDPYNPLISPMLADLHGLPPLLLHVGEDEILLDDSTRLVQRAKEAGVDARVVVWPHMWHVFQAFYMFAPEAQESIDQVGEFIQVIFAGEVSPL